MGNVLCCCPNEDGENPPYMKITDERSTKKYNSRHKDKFIKVVDNSKLKYLVHKPSIEVENMLIVDKQIEHYSHKLEKSKERISEIQRLLSGDIRKKTTSLIGIDYSDLYMSKQRKLLVEIMYGKRFVSGDCALKANYSQIKIIQPSHSRPNPNSEEAKPFAKKNDLDSTKQKNQFFKLKTRTVKYTKDNPEWNQCFALFYKGNVDEKFNNFSLEVYRWQTFKTKQMLGTRNTFQLSPFEDEKIHTQEVQLFKKGDLTKIQGRLSIKVQLINNERLLHEENINRLEERVTYLKEIRSKFINIKEEYYNSVKSNGSSILRESNLNDQSHIAAFYSPIMATYSNSDERKSESSASPVRYDKKSIESPLFSHKYISN